MDLRILYKRGLFCLCLVLGLWSCESALELEVPTETFMDRQTVFSDGEGAEAAARGMYTQMVTSNHTFYAHAATGGLAILGGMSADELVHPTQVFPDLVQFEQNALMADNNAANEKAWQSLYRSIYSANTLVENLEGSGLDEELVERLQGEALFIRAFCHFYLVNLFGDVPLVLTSDFKKNADIPRTLATEVYEQIEADLLQARELLNWNYEGERTRPNKGAATALLARVYLYIENWEKAEDMATEVLEQTQQYELVTLEEIVRANNREALWQFHISSTSPDASTPDAENFQDSFAYFYNSLREGFPDAFEAGDRRKTIWINQHATGVWMASKYKRTLGSGLPLEYSTIMRLAEVYLIRAEARAQQNNLTGPNSAASDLNEIRGRADLGGTTATTKTDMLNAIMQERKVELFTEWGHRWLDLKRTGKALDILGPIKTGLTGDDLLWPIPQKEINNNPALRGHQNPGY
ncbi:RagB/SusD family nutrient uptake outer membrane protein [Sinomicrobium pectinilyticum]|uniref:RagB/SusD family nutrient uptake outer membrane protein n=1 Tax=Sinomicrobium pectinilyticum TaxID=1084421 RepID=A0A3N0EJE8_SINP1|nr:RagB/SusD family nutrient uptake outer membrane protein [Sinomicrobium pectinilyticum]RNL87789.1 RagB/SusD family nutrient uptake outer membrane protein [Sinomicrobium pectinilyticum]